MNVVQTVFEFWDVYKAGSIKSTNIGVLVQTDVLCGVLTLLLWPVDNTYETSIMTNSKN